MKFELGQTVEWVSQSGGYSKRKEGIIVRIIRPGETPYRLRDFDYSVYRKVDASTVLPRYHEESYLIAVKGKTNKSKSKLYWPRVSHLNPIPEKTTNKQ